MQCSLERYPAVAAFLSGSPQLWPELKIDEQAMLGLCTSEDLSPLCVQRLSQSARSSGWPSRLSAFLSEKARLQAGVELLRAAEIRAVLDALADAGVIPILIKGTPLAYSVYEAPALRPREDTDLLIARAHVDAARRALCSLGYAATACCHDLFSQFEMQKVDRFGVVHAFDVHWKISTQPVFEDVLTYDELLPRTRPVPLLGPHAITAGHVDALLLACIHPVMHHRNAQRVLWIYDAHLLASALTRHDFRELARRARQKGVAAVCAHQLRLAQRMFQTPVPWDTIEALSLHGDEPSERYLSSQRRWRHDLLSSVRAVPRFGGRMALLREVLLPSPSYMLGAYGLHRKPLALWLLPALYVHRNVRGVWKVLIGKK
jgi:hypothetical protein